MGSGQRNATPVIGGAILAGVSGLLVVFSFPPASLTPFVFVSLVPLLVALSAAPTIRTALARGWMTGIVGHLGAFMWVLPTVARLEPLSPAAAAPFFALFIWWQATQFAIFAMGVAWVKRRGPCSAGAAPVVVIAAWWGLLEWAFPKILPWSLGETVAAASWLRQAADVGGVYGLSFFVVVINGCVANALQASNACSARWHAVAAAAAVLVGVAGYGALRSQAERPDPQGARLTVAVVQGGLAAERGDLAAANEAAWRTYAQLTTAAFATCDDPAASSRPESGHRHGSAANLIVWPETVLRVYLRRDPTYRRKIANLVRRLGRPLLVGALDVPDQGRGELNVGMLIEPQRGGDADVRRALRVDAPERFSAQCYHKTTLLPFGEYVPGATWLPLLTRWHTTGDFVPGTAAGNLTLHTEAMNEVEANGAESHATIPLAPSICFEAIYPGAFNRSVRDGAQFLVNLSDDGWFEDAAAAHQHFNAVRLRAVETRRWLVRASNSGISAFVDPTGEIVASLPLGAVGVLSHGVNGSTALPLYVRYGNWPVVVMVMIVIVWGAVGL